MRSWKTKRGGMCRGGKDVGMEGRSELLEGVLGACWEVYEHFFPHLLHFLQRLIWIFVAHV